MPSTLRANLLAPEFPLLTDFQGHTVLVSGIDQVVQDTSVPQVYYMHNILPTKHGLTSVGYLQVADGAVTADNTFEDIYTIRDINENSALFSHSNAGNNYVLPINATEWLKTTSISPGPGGYVTTAHVNGQTYICFSYLGVYTYNFTTNTLVKATLIGLDETKIIGVTASNGYMIAWTSTVVVWSSLTNPLDFVPSLVTGAGGGSLQLAKAAITVCLPSNGGFIVYTKKNAIAETYSGNSRYPFTAKEIIGAGGLSTPSLSAYDGNSTDQLSYTTAGFQQISMNSATTVLPQVTDFIAGSQFEDYDEILEQFSVQAIASPMKKKLTQVGNRYLVISYGINSLTHAIVIDLALQRWGKLKLPHVDCFEYFYPSSDVVEAPKRNIGFLQSNGAIQVAVVSYNTLGSLGVLMLGKYQLDRNRYLELQSIELDSINPDSMLNIKVLTSIDGTNVTRTTVPPVARRVGSYRRYDLRATGLNYSIILSGAMHLNSLEFKNNDAGEVR